MAMTFESESHALPLHAPLYFPRAGQRFLWHKFAAVSFRVDGDVLRDFVPAPLELAGDQVRVGTTYHYQSSHGMPVMATSVRLRVRYGDVEGSWYLLTLAPHDDSLVANREELGSQVIQGEVELWSEGNNWFGSARRNGEELVRLSVFPEEMKQIEREEPANLILFKRIPSADPSARAWSQILSIRNEPPQTLEYSVGRGSVHFAPCEWGLHRLQPIGPVRGFFSHRGAAPLGGKGLECLWEEKPDPIGA